MKLNEIPASQVAQALSAVGKSIEHETIDKKTGEYSGHTYVFIDEDNGEIIDLALDSTREGAASFKQISRLVEKVLNSIDIQREQKVEMLQGYKKITEKYEQRKNSGFFAYIYAYLFGQAREVKRAEEIIEKGLHAYQPPDGPGQYTFDGATYVGVFKDGFLEGQGKFTDSDGKIYEGEFQRGKLNGKGKVTTLSPQELVLEGNFKDGKLNGEGRGISNGFVFYQGRYHEGKIDGPGTAFFAGGRKIEGEFQQGLNGFAKITDADGTVSEGLLRDGVLRGFGTMTRPDGKIYEGEFKDGSLQGWVSVTDNGKVYKGKLENGELNGPGYISFADGSSYQGEFTEGKLNGEGVGFNASGLVFYKGEFHDDEIKGRGEMIFSDKTTIQGIFENGLTAAGVITEPGGKTYLGELKKGVLEKQKAIIQTDDDRKSEGGLNGEGKIIKEGRVYEGFFKNGLLHGKGVVKDSEGIIYKGEFQDGELDGEGMIAYPSGVVYEGTFKEGKLNGQGTSSLDGFVTYKGGFEAGQINGKGAAFFKDGRTIVGEFKNGLNGEGTITYPDGIVYEGEFKSGLFHGKGTLTPLTGDKIVGEFSFGVNGQGIFYKADGSSELVPLPPLRPPPPLPM